MVPLAHAGHWINAFLYLLPVVIIAVLLWVANRRDRRRDEDANGGG